MKAAQTPPEKPHPYLLFILLLSIFALAALAVERAAPLDDEARTLLGYTDFAVCILFFLDFVVSLIRAQNRRAYFFTWGWLDLVSSIPTVQALRWGRSARILRILRVLRAVRSARVIYAVLIQKRTQSAVLGALLFSILLVVSSSIMIIHVESGPDANIRTAEDALWWSATTITTVGYGDRYPLTAEGRLIAVFLMIAGVGLFGTFSGLIASWLLHSSQTEIPPHPAADMALLRQEVAELRELLLRRGKQDES